MNVFKAMQPAEVVKKEKKKKKPSTVTPHTSGIPYPLISSWSAYLF